MIKVRRARPHCIPVKQVKGGCSGERKFQLMHRPVTGNYLQPRCATLSVSRAVTGYNFLADAVYADRP
jgi:hypothetical protein